MAGGGARAGWEVGHLGEYKGGPNLETLQVDAGLGPEESDRAGGL